MNAGRMIFCMIGFAILTTNFLHGASSPRPDDSSRPEDTSPRKITFESLLEDMTDRARLARFPDPPYRCTQYSSFDRRSTAPAPEDGTFRPEQGRDWGKGWFANHDFANFLRDERREGRTEKVLMDQEGPGAVVRFWNALGGTAWDPGGIVRIYLDDAETPVIAMHNKALVGGDGLVGEPFSYLASDESTNPGWRGRNLYLPIPFAKRCKITFDISLAEGKKGWFGYYYQINVREYPAGTEVVTFDLKQLDAATPKLDAVGRRLTGKGLDDADIRTLTVGDLPIAPGASRKIDCTGTGAIRSISLSLKAEDSLQALRSTVLKITFDGEDRVWCPLGSFFGVGYTGSPHDTFLVRRDAEGVMTANWVMPFRRLASIAFLNEGKRDVVLAGLRLTRIPWTWDARSLYFHAAWHELRNADTNIRRDVNYVTVKGKGVYVGDTLTLFNTHPDWWGEGDEKIFVDREPFPSHFGTGTEDYYGYAWCRPQPFSRPFHSQPSGAGNKTVGVTTNNRYRMLDAIPFEQAIRVDMELWHPFRAKVNYAPAAFWYARPGATCNVKPAPEAVRLPVARKKEDVTDG